MKGILHFAVLAALLFVASCDPEAESSWLKHAKVCFEENHVSEESLADFEKYKDDPDQMEENVKCALHCMMLKEGYMDENGKQVPDAIRAKLEDKDKETFDKALAACTSVTGTSPCDTAFQNFRCMGEQANM